MRSAEHLADLERRLASHAITGEAKDWLLKSLHPAGAFASPGFPDESTTAVVRPEFREQLVIPPPVAGTWDCLIWRPPGDVIAAVVATAPAPADFTSATAPAGAVLHIVYAQESEPIPDFNTWNQTGAPVTLNTGAIWPKLRPAGFRHVYSGLTAYLTAAAVADQGSVYAAQFQGAPSTSVVVRSTAVNTVNGFNIAMQEILTNLPFSETAMLQMKPDTYVGSARDGVYMPLRLCGPTQPFTSLWRPGRTMQQSAGGVAYVSVGSSALNAGVHNLVASTGGAFSWVTAWQDLAGSVGTAFDTGYDNVNHGVVIFRGLAGTGGGLSATVTLKVYAGLEVIPAPDSPMRSFARTALRPYPRALEAYYSVCHELPDAYPAAFNSLGTILSSIGSVASRIWPVVRSIGSAVVPAIDQLAGYVPPKANGDPTADKRLVYKAPAGPSSVSAVSRRSRVTVRGRGRRRRRR